MEMLLPPLMDSSHSVPASLTQMLRQWAAGDPQMADRLVPLVYEELKRIAARELRRERPAHTLQATALVNEAYLRLRKIHGMEWESRTRFLAFAAHVMRRVLVDHARRKGFAKRGGLGVHVTLAEAEQIGVSRPPDLVALDEALARLGTIDPRKATVVELRFFGGLSVEETAEVLRVSPETIKREWRRAKAWLYRELAGRGEASGEA
jgi:RNA polymerase sigma factor (TIGR02999 family)